MLAFLPSSPPRRHLTILDMSNSFFVIQTSVTRSYFWAVLNLLLNFPVYAHLLFRIPYHFCLLCDALVFFDIVSNSLVANSWISVACFLCLTSRQECMVCFRLLLELSVLAWAFVKVNFPAFDYLLGWQCFKSFVPWCSMFVLNPFSNYPNGSALDWCENFLCFSNFLWLQCVSEI